MTRNFKLSEFNCRSGAVMPANVQRNITELAKNLQVLRDAVGLPIRITSGYRSPEHNASVGGAKASTHLTGKGADFAVIGMSPSRVVEVIERLIQEGKMKQGGLKAYSSWVHYDIRGVRARW